MNKCKKIINNKITKKIKVKIKNKKKKRKTGARRLKGSYKHSHDDNK